MREPYPWRCHGPVTLIFTISPRRHTSQACQTSRAKSHPSGAQARTSCIPAGSRGGL